MKIEEYINICRDCGLRILEINEYYFKPYLWRNYSYPLNYKIAINERLIRRLRLKYLMTTVYIDSKIKNTYEFILNTDKYTLDQFKRKTRNRIKKSLKNCLFQRPELQDMLNYGYEINKQTLKMQRRKDKSLTDFKLWKNYVESLYSHDNIEILGAYYNNRMVGYLIAFELDGEYSFFNAFIDRKDSEITSPMNGLLYVMINQLIEKNGSINISYGLEPFENLTELERFKLSMLFEKVPSTRAYIINPILLSIFELIIFFTICLPKRKTVRNKLVKNAVRLYQGHRILSR